MPPSHKGNLFVISAPSGAGKTSLVKALLQQDDEIRLSISNTTREKRPGETHGVDYYFTPKNDFEKMIDEKAFFEYAKVFDNYYGTSRQVVEKQLFEGFDVILEIDWQGAQQIRELHKETISIFIQPPSLKALNDRLQGRGQDSQVVIDKRMAQAQEEIKHYNEYDYVVINDDFDVALQELATIFKANRLTLNQQQQRNSNILKELVEQRL